MSAVTFTTDQVTPGISNCRNTRAFEPDKLGIFHLKNLVPKTIEYLTSLFNDIMSNPGDLEVIPKPGKDSSLSTLYRAISLLCPAAKVMGLSYLPPSTHTCSQLLTNTDSDPDAQPLMHYYN